MPNLNKATEIFVGTQKHQRTITAIALYLDGKTAYSIGKQVGVTPQAIDNIVKTYNLNHYKV